MSSNRQRGTHNGANDIVGSRLREVPNEKRRSLVGVSTEKLLEDSISGAWRERSGRGFGKRGGGRRRRRWSGSGPAVALPHGARGRPSLSLLGGRRQDSSGRTAREGDNGSFDDGRVALLSLFGSRRGSSGRRLDGELTRSGPEVVRERRETCSHWERSQYRGNGRGERTYKNSP